MVNHEVLLNIIKTKINEIKSLESKENNLITHWIAIILYNNQCFKFYVIQIFISIVLIYK